MKLKDICANRNIPNTDTDTPLLVPAFSSSVFGIYDSEKKHIIGDLFKILKKRLKSALLLSAFDIYYEYVDKNEIPKTKVVFLDSGMYEKDCYTKSGKNVDWSYQKYLTVLDSVKPTPLCVLVNYDKKK